MASVYEEALNDLKRYYEAQPFSNFVLALRDIGKQISFLRGVGERLYTSFLVAGTVTGRLASKYSDFGVGTNLQNIDRRLRRIFVADPGMILVNIDLEQADARNVGAIIWNLLYETHGAAYAGSILMLVKAAMFTQQSLLLYGPSLLGPMTSKQIVK